MDQSAGKSEILALSDGVGRESNASPPLGNGFAHDLGLAMEEHVTNLKPTTKRRVRLRFKIQDTLIAVQKKPSCSAAELKHLDDVAIRPPWLAPTVHDDERNAVVVDALALYWGVRRLIFDHTSDHEGVRSLQAMIGHNRRRGAGSSDRRDGGAAVGRGSGPGPTATSRPPSTRTQWRRHRRVGD